jgi:hypothetical protein
VTENSITRISAKKKFGSAWPNTAMASASRSIQLFGRRAATTPSGIAIRSAKASESKPSCSVTGSLSSTRAATSLLK